MVGAKAPIIFFKKNKNFLKKVLTIFYIYDIMRMQGETREALRKGKKEDVQIRSWF